MYAISAYVKETHSLAHVDEYGRLVQVEEPVDEDGPLKAGGGHHEVQPHGGEAVALQEGHQEPEPDEDHHVHVLEHWGKRKMGSIS